MSEPMNEERIRNDALEYAAQIADAHWPESGHVHQDDAVSCQMSISVEIRRAKTLKKWEPTEHERIVEQAAFERGRQAAAEQVRKMVVQFQMTEQDLAERAGAEKMREAILRSLVKPAASAPSRELFIAHHFDHEGKVFMTAGVFSSREEAEKRVEETGSGAVQAVKLNEPVQLIASALDAAAQAMADDIAKHGPLCGCAADEPSAGSREGQPFLAPLGVVLGNIHERFNEREPHTGAWDEQSIVVAEVIQKLCEVYRAGPTESPLAGLVAKLRGHAKELRSQSFGDNYKLGMSSAYENIAEEIEVWQDKLVKDIQKVVSKWDDGKNDYRGRVIIGELKAALADTRGSNVSR